MKERLSSAIAALWSLFIPQTSELQVHASHKTAIKVLETSSAKNYYYSLGVEFSAFNFNISYKHSHISDSET